jgi:hypothetical protein
MSYNEKEIESLHAKIVSEIQTAGKQVLTNFGDQAKENIANTKEFGGTKLRKTAKTKLNIENPDKQKITVSMDSKIAVIMEEGSKPHDIVPKKKKWLYFEGSNGPVFTKHVNHPGTRATKFFEKANTAAAESVGPELQEKISKILKG